jgi:tetratricopeptide (TPR) repeat protein
MSTDAYVVLACVTGAVASFLAVRVENLSRKRWFQIGGLAVFLALTMLTWRSTRSSMNRGGQQAATDFIVTMISMMAVGLFWVLFLLHSLGGIVANTVRSLLSLDDLYVPPPYSLVDAAIAKRDYPTALQRLLEVVRDYPEEPVPLRRLGDLYLLMGRADEAVEAYRRAVVVEPDSEQKLLYVFSASEVLADVRNDPVSALTEIERFLAGFPQVKGREFADERMMRLRERISGVRDLS